MRDYQECVDEINAASLDAAVALLVHWVGIADSTGLERLRAPMVHHVIDRIVHLVKQDHFARHLRYASEAVKTWPEWKQGVLGKPKQGDC